MYINGKMRPVETIPGMGEKGYRTMMEEVNSSLKYFMYFVNATLYPQHNK
jgi:hypothetical protein